MRVKYDDVVVNAANDALLSMGEDEWNNLRVLEDRIIDQLKLALKTGNLQSSEMAEFVRIHTAWVQAHRGRDRRLTHKMHVSLGQMYVVDPRSQGYYASGAGRGAAAFLVEAIEVLGI